MRVCQAVSSKCTEVDIKNLDHALVTLALALNPIWKTIYPLITKNHHYHHSQTSIFAIRMATLSLSDPRGVNYSIGARIQALTLAEYGVSATEAAKISGCC